LNISKVSYSRKFNLGNYETMDLEVEAQLNEKDNPLEGWSILADNTEMWFIDYQRKKAKNMESEGKPQAQTPSVQTPFSKPSNSPPSILTKFPQEMADNLTATLENGVWKIKPTHLLETALFAKTCKFVEDLGGSYVQEPKNKHWEIKA
jgi:hypothetical protein